MKLNEEDFIAVARHRFWLEPVWLGKKRKWWFYQGLIVGLLSLMAFWGPAVLLEIDSMIFLGIIPFAEWYTIQLWWEIKDLPKYQEWFLEQITTEGAEGDYADVSA